MNLDRKESLLKLLKLWMRMLHIFVQGGLILLKFNNNLRLILVYIKKMKREQGLNKIDLI